MIRKSLVSLMSLVAVLLLVAAPSPGRADSSGVFCSGQIVLNSTYYMVNLSANQWNTIQYGTGTFAGVGARFTGQVVGVSIAGTRATIQISGLYWPTMPSVGSGTPATATLIVDKSLGKYGSFGIAIKPNGFPTYGLNTDGSIKMMPFAASYITMFKH